MSRNEHPAHPLFWARAFTLFFFASVGMLFLQEDRQSGSIHATACAVLAMLLVSLPPLKIAGHRVTSLLSVPALWLATFLAIELALPPRCSPERVESQARSIIDQLDAYRASHGAYPAAFAAAGIAPPKFRCGTFRYRLNSDGVCSLSVGNYTRGGFAALWNSKDREWDFGT
jgi:hypothetical protein